MSLINAPSPHTSRHTDTGAVMRQVVYATLPGLAALVWQFGLGSLLNVLWAVLVAVVCEALFLRARGKPVAFYLKDWSAVVTAVLLGLALPPTAPWWLTLIGVGFAIVVAKQLYGGLGMNPFNPAMIGYVLLLISFPVAMTQWIAPGEAPAPADSLALFLGQAPADAFTGATPLDTFRTWAGDAEALAGRDILAGQLAGPGWEAVNLAFLLGGLYLLARRIITWQIPGGVPGRPGAAGADRPPGGRGALCRPAVPSVFRRRHAGRVLHRHRPGERRHQPPGPVYLRAADRPADLGDPHLRRLPGRGGVRGAAAQSVGAVY